MRYPRAADAPGRHRGLERGTACRDRDPRFHDRHRLAEVDRRTADERRTRHGRHGWLRPGQAGAERACVPRRMGEAAFSRSRSPWACRAAGISTWDASRARTGRRRKLSVNDLLPEMVRRRWRECSRSADWCPDDEISAGHVAAGAEAGQAQAVAWRVAKTTAPRGPTERQTKTSGCIQSWRPRARQEYSSHRPTRDCRATCAATSGPSNAAWLPHVPGSASRPISAKIRNGSTPCVFDGPELWGPDADPTLKVSIDAFEPYLEPA